MPERTDKLNSLIQQQLSQIINQEVEFPEGTLISLTRIKTSPDNKNAKIFISVIPANKQGKALEILRKNAKKLHQELQNELKTKFTPNLSFHIDENEIFASQIDKLLDEIN